jgi:AcrR family transcriptional regulator
MPKISQAHRDARRQQILDAAIACFSRDGFHATTTADIVREAGVSQGVLYLYFATKDDIIVALGDDRRHGEAFVTALAEKEHDPVEGLLALIQLYGKRLGSPAGAAAVAARSGLVVAMEAILRLGLWWRGKGGRGRRRSAGCRG